MDQVDIGFFEECIRFQTTLFILFFAKHFHKMKISGHFSNFFILHVFYCNILDILEEMNFISYKIFASSFRVLSWQLSNSILATSQHQFDVTTAVVPAKQ